MPKTLCFASIQGGAGRSTLAILTAEELHLRGHRVHLVDADPQATSKSWQQAGNGFPFLVTQATGKDAHDLTEELRRPSAGVDYVIIDTEQAGSRVSELSALLSLSDLVVLPVSASFAQGYFFQELVNVLERATRGSVPSRNILVALNMSDGRRDRERSALDSLASRSPWPVANVPLKNLVAFFEACHHGTGLAGRARSKEARNNLSMFVDELLGKLLV